MKIAALVARILLGLEFVIFGLNAFLHFIPAPPMTGLPAQFMGSIIASHYYVAIFALQIISGALLLAGRYLPLALTLLGPILVNILLFHICMAPTGLPIALLTALLWFIVFLSVRPAFNGIFAARV